jgi:hypothetical protein
MAKRETPPLVRLGPDVTTVPGVEPDQYMLIGRVIVLWSALEHVMQDTIWHVLGVPFEDGRVLTQRTDAARKLQWLRTFAKRHISPEQKAELDLVLDEIELLQDDRNFIAHGTWFTTKPDNVPWASSLRIKGLPDEVVSENFPEPRMVEICQGIVKARNALAIWRNRLLASRDKSSEEPPTDPPIPP